MNKGDYSRAVVLRNLIALSSLALFGRFAIGLIFNQASTCISQGGDGHRSVLHSYGNLYCLTV